MAYQPKSYKKFVATAATATLVATAVVPAAFANEAETAAFTDVPKSYEAAIDFVVSNNISKGLTETTYGIDAQIKRGDVAIIIANAAGLNDKDAKASGFKDVPTRGTLAVNSLKAAGVVDGKSATNFGFADSITRGEAAIMLQRAFKITGDVKDVKFTDVSDRYDDAVAALLAHKVTKGVSTTKFGTDNPIKRGDFAKFIYALKEFVNPINPEAPVLKYTGESTINVAYGANFAIPVVTATDNVDANVTVTSVITNSAGTVLSAIDTKVPGTYKVTYSAVDSDGNKAKDVVVTVVVAAGIDAVVSSATATNGTELVVKFNQPIDENTISLADFTITPLDDQSLTTNNLVGTLSDDKMTYTIKTAGGEFFSKRYDLKLAAESVKTTAGKDVAKFETTINVADEVAPSISSVTYTPAGSGKVDVTVTFNEQVSTVGTVSLDGAVVTPTFTPNTNKMVLPGLDAGKTFKLDVIGATDVAGNIANPLSTTVATTNDTVLPTASVTVSDSTIKIDFSENVVDSGNNAFAVKVNGGSPLDAVKDQNDSTIYTVDATSALGSNTFLNNAEVTVTNIYDLAGNKGTDIKTTANLKKDTVAPKFVSAEADGTKLVLKYDEAILPASVQNITATDIALKYVTKDGVLVNLTPLTDFAATATAGRDLNGNGSIDAGTEEVKYVEIALTETAGKDFITTNKLVEGTYTVTVAKDQLTDVANNKVVETTFNVVVGSDSASKTVTYSATNADLANNQIKVKYTEEMGSSALSAGNYTLAGSALPTGTSLTFVDNKSNVLITLPEGYITATGPRVLTVSNVTAVDGDTQNTSAQQEVVVNLKENVAPTATKVTINSDTEAVVDFSEVVTGTPTTATTTVKLNGTTVTPALSVSNGDLVLTFASGTLKATDKVSVEFTGSQLADDAGNKVKNSTINN